MRICSNLITLTLTTLVVVSAHAAPMIYSVESTAVLDCSGSPHGFWTSDLRHGGGACSQYYDFSEDTTLTVDTMNGNAVLAGSAINPQGIKAVLDFTWQNLVAHSDWSGEVKNGGGGNPADWLYFASGSGSASFYSGNTLLGTVALALIEDTALQIGDGANDKSAAFGASSWLKPLVGHAHSGNHWGNNWDFNMDLTATRVPAEGTSILLLMGLSALALRRTRSDWLRS